MSYEDIKHPKRGGREGEKMSEGGLNTIFTVRAGYSASL